MERKDKIPSRMDDTEDAIKLRIQTFLSKVPDIINEYKIKFKKVSDKKADILLLSHVFLCGFTNR